MWPCVAHSACSSAMDIHLEQLKSITRRHFFQRSATGIGTAALAALTNRRSSAEERNAVEQSANPLAPQRSHFPGKAKHVIYIHMAGSPSQLDLFDYKPKLNELN